MRALAPLLSPRVEREQEGKIIGSGCQQERLRTDFNPMCRTPTVFPTKWQVSAPRVPIAAARLHREGLVGECHARGPIQYVDRRQRVME